MDKIRPSPFAVYSGIKIPATGSVKNYADATSNYLLEFHIHVYGVTTKRFFETACPRCAEREGKKKGTPGLVDFHVKSEIVEPQSGKIRVQLQLCCYPKCSGDTGYL
jgi:hypothetical protein